MRTLRIGTRRSALALAQAEQIRAALAGEQIPAEVVPMSTAGDDGADPGPAGGKGLWTDAIARAVRAGEVDMAVHSAKDLPLEDDEDLVLGAVPTRADPRDVLVVREQGEWLHPGVRVGTSSLRRRAQILAAQPEATLVDLRGNVDTRLRKLGDGVADVIVLAAAGLQRLGIVSEHVTPLGVDVMVPAPGQGAIAVQCRAGAREIRAILELLDDRAARIALTAERAVTRALGGDCSLPLGALAVTRGDTVRLVGRVLSVDGGTSLEAAAETTDPARAARMVATQLHRQGAADLLAGATGA